MKLERSGALLVCCNLKWNKHELDQQNRILSEYS